jgi:glycerate dehydrogenase
MSASVRIVFLDRATLPDFIALKAFAFEHEVTAYDQTAPADVAQRIRNAHIVITNKVPVSAQDVAQASELKLVAVAATGTNIVDIEACRDKGIVVTNIRNYAVNTVPEHTLALIFALRRSLLPYHRSVGQGRWAQSGQFCYFDYPVSDLADSTIGIFGSGALGSAVARRAQALGMKVLFAARKGETDVKETHTLFEEVIAQADILTLHLPLTPATRHMIGAAELAQMKPTAILINTARGGLVDEAALAEALENNSIGGAGFDVVTQEPMPDTHPFMRLMNRPDFILTPHVAWASRQAIQSLADQLVDNINAFVGNDIRNQV